MRDMDKRVKKKISVWKRDIWDKHEFPYKYYKEWIEPLKKKEKKHGI